MSAASAVPSTCSGEVMACSGLTLLPQRCQRTAARSCAHETQCITCSAPEALTWL